MSEPSPPPPASEWDVPSQPSHGPRGPYVRAAIAVWITAAVELLLFGCCAGGVLVLGLAPEAQWRQALEQQQATEQQIQQFLDVQPYLAVAAIVIAAAMCLPALVLLYLGFRIRSGGRGASIVAIVLMSLHALLLGFLLLGTLAQAVIAGAGVLDLLLSILMLGGPVALLVWSILWLVAALGASMRPPGRLIKKDERLALSQEPEASEAKRLSPLTAYGL